MPCPHYHQGPHRLVVRTSRRGRDIPGSIPGENIAIAVHAARWPIKSVTLRWRTQGEGGALRPSPSVRGLDFVHLNCVPRCVCA